MTSLLQIITIVCALAIGAHAQIKTSGIKTHYPSYNSSNLVAVNSSEHYNYESGGMNTNSFADGHSYTSTHASEGHYGHYLGANVHPTPTRAPLILDPIAEFINKTRSSMASGICYTEVPTSSLVRNRAMATVGNGTTPNMSKIQICCDGYERNAHVFARCDPVCADDCPNGICTAPNTCVCIPGHVRDQEGRCISTCPIGCGNGVCTEYGECQCKPGYILELATRQYCVPNCEPGCAFGKCVAPNKCDCAQGYQATASGVCEPKCDNCFNGQCTAPGVCACNKGYLKQDGVCEPICSLGCSKGRCIAPDTCECSNGFQLDRTGANCVPHCDKPCLNGVCDGYNTCTCNTGYVQDEYQQNVCQPHCPLGCTNGYCSSPNFCICKPGYIKSGIKGRQTCIPV